MCIYKLSILTLYMDYAPEIEFLRSNLLTTAIKEYDDIFDKYLPEKKQKQKIKYPQIY